MIPNSQNDSKGHVNHTENDGNLHFVGIEIGDLVFGKLPHRIHADGVRILRVVAVARVGHEHLMVHRRDLFVRQIDFVGRAENVHRFRENVVVNEARVDGKDAHQQHDVTSGETNHPNLGSEHQTNQSLLLLFII